MTSPPSVRSKKVMLPASSLSCAGVGLYSAIAVAPLSLALRFLNSAVELGAHPLKLRAARQDFVEFGRRACNAVEDVK